MSSMGPVYFFLGMGASLIGAYFIGMAVLRKLFKATVTHKQLLGFTGAFIISFVALTAAVIWVIDVNNSMNASNGGRSSFVYSR